MARSFGRPQAAVCAVLALGCARNGAEAEARVEFGVFFGGQVQELREIRRVTAPSEQTQGFRITLQRALAEPLPVHWELLLPEASAGAARAARIGDAVLPAGRTRLDVPIELRAIDPLGAWRAQLELGGRRVFERDFRFVDPKQAAPEPPPLGVGGEAP